MSPEEIITMVLLADDDSHEFVGYDEFGMNKHKDNIVQNVTNKNLEESLKWLKTVVPQTTLKPDPNNKEIEGIISRLTTVLKAGVSDPINDLTLRCFLGILNAEKGYQCYFILPWSTDLGNCILITSLSEIKEVKGTKTLNGLYAYTVGTGAGGVTGSQYACYYLKNILVKDGISTTYRNFKPLNSNSLLEKGYYGLLTKDYTLASNYFKKLNELIGTNFVSIYSDAIVAANTGKYKGPNLSALSVMELHSLIDGSFSKAMYAAIKKIANYDKGKDMIIAYTNHYHQNAKNADEIYNRLNKNQAIMTTKNTKKASDYNMSRYKAFKRYLYKELNYV